MLLFPTPPFRKRRGRANPIADVPPAPPPPPDPALVVAATLSEDGLVATLWFDQPLAFSGGPFDFSGGAVQFSDQNPVGVNIVGDDGNGLAFDLTSPVVPDSGWNLNGQPGWLATTVAAPQGGSFA